MTPIRDCPAPDPDPAGPTRYAVPAGAVDTHAHVVGLPPAHPLVAERSYTPPAAPADGYLAMLDATGMAHGVLVQVSVHGTDNRLLLETLAAHRERLRGIAVIPLGLPEGELLAMRDAGIVGLRLNVLYGGGINFDRVEAYGALAREMGWHLEFLIDARALPPLAARLSRLPVPFVVDHMGHMPTAAGLTDPGFRTLIDLVRDGAWVKFSGAFRTSVEGAPYADTIPFARALNDAAPDRCLWVPTGRTSPPGTARRSFRRCWTCWPTGCRTKAGAGCCSWTTRAPSTASADSSALHGGVPRFDLKACSTAALDPSRTLVKSAYGWLRWGQSLIKEHLSTSNSI